MTRVVRPRSANPAADRGRQIRRQWKLLRALEAARRGLTGSELLDAVGERCSARTLYRDLEDLQAAGFPLLSERGRWRALGAGEGAWTIPVQATQVLALALAGDLLAPAEGSWLAEPLSDLRAQLSSMLTPTGRAYCEELRRTAVATLFGPGSYGGRRVELAAIHEAIERQHRLRIVHAKPREKAKARVVEPYSTWYHSGRLYLIAYCTSAEDVRTFAVERIQKAEVLDEPFDPDPSFDPAAFARRGFGVYHGAVHHTVVDFAGGVAHLVRERRYHHTQRVTPRGEGVRLTMDAAGLPEIAAWVAGFGGNARPVAPPELVAAVRRLHEDGLRAMESREVVTPDDRPV